jgi:hypothetical protein
MKKYKYIINKQIVNKDNYFGMHLFNSVKKVETVGVFKKETNGKVYWELRFIITINRNEYIADVLTNGRNILKDIKSQSINIKIKWV